MEIGSIYGVVLQSCFKRLRHWFTLCAKQYDKINAVQENC
jgi:hypothetical protein